MQIGIDLDNTIVCYDGLFHQVAVRQGLIPSDVPTDKQAVRDYLRAAGQNDEWTGLQGLVYGQAMSEAKPYAGVVDFFGTAARNQWTIFVISHRSRYPYLGPRQDLHEAARRWLTTHGLVGPPPAVLREASLFLEESLEAKLRRIATQRCEVFIDDLPELLLHPDFPDGVDRVCFDPSNRCTSTDVQCVTAWNELASRWFGEADR